MSDHPSIRFVTRQDYEPWLRLWDGYITSDRPTALASEITETTWARFFEADEPLHALVAESGGELIGMAHYVFHRSSRAIAPICCLLDLFTDETARGKGVGRALINGVYEQARLAGSSRVYWHAHKTNPALTQLYDKVAQDSGFVVYRKQF
jgi:GNAT superfamily N-acetyltransferase